MLFCKAKWRTIIEAFTVEWLNANRQLGWVLVPLLAFLEACPGVGLFVSGIVLLSVCTLLYAEQILSLWIMLPLAFCGACIADHLGYYMGRWVGPKFHQSNFAQKRVDVLQRAERFIRQYGAYSVVLGRLITAVRSKVPLLVGVSGFGRLRFTLLDIFACAIWSAGLGLLVVGLDHLLL
ncbi:MAG TPA: hypothetical protein DD440_01905 [Porticoccaceae bacterium]|nr:hypothetical protein [Porticoccaceae bacterium]